MIHACGLEWNTLSEIAGYESLVSPHIAVSTAQKRSGAYSLLVPPQGSSGDSYAWWTIPLAQEYFWQIACYPTQTPLSVELDFMHILSGATIMFTLWLQPGGTIVVKLQSTGTTLGTSTSSLNVSVWNVIEIHTVIAASGTFALRINGALQFTYSGDTRTTGLTTAGTLRVRNDGMATMKTGDTYWDDFIVNDPNGSYNNSWPNGLKIALLKPTGNVTDYSNWTPNSAVDNYSCVDELPPSMTDFLSATVNGKQDLYVIENCPANMGPVAAVIATYWCQKSGSPSINHIKRLMKMGANLRTGSEIDIPLNFSIAKEILEISPDTSQVFTDTEINDMYFGVEAVT
jgi:hypothetical protein